MSHNPPTPRAEQAFFYYEMCLEAQRTTHDAIERTTKLFGSDDSFIARRMYEITCENEQRCALRNEDMKIIDELQTKLRVANDHLVDLLRPVADCFSRNEARLFLEKQGISI